MCSFCVQIHACVLSPHSCRFITLPPRTRAEEQDRSEPQAEAATNTASSRSHALAVPHYDPATTLVLYPSLTAVPLSDPSIAALLPDIQTVVVIESTWQKGGAVYSHPALGLSRLRAVRLSEYESTYWRYQELGRHALCTLEAIYHFCSELLAIEQRTGGTQRRDAMDGTQLDDLLYLYAAQHSRLHDRYAGQRTRQQLDRKGEEAGEEQRPSEQPVQQDEAQQHSRDAASPCRVQALSASNADTNGSTAATAVRAGRTRQKPPPRAWKPM